MVQHSLTFVALADTSATYTWTGAADLNQPSAYDSLANVTFTNPDTIIINDGDATLGDEPSGLQTVVEPAGTLRAGSIVEAKFRFDFTTASGETYRVVVLTEVDAAGDTIGLSGFVFEGEIPPLDETLQLTSSAKIDNAITDFSILTPAPTPPACFTDGTLIRTITGDRPVETLVPGDLVETREHGFQPIKAISRTDLEFKGVMNQERFKPISITAHSLGNGLPERDLCISPQHRVLMRDETDQSELLVAAKSLVTKPGIRVMKGKRSVSYIHIVLEQHEILISNGTATESFFAGPVAFLSVSKECQRELIHLFPKLLSGSPEPVMTPARPFAKVQDVKKVLHNLVVPAPASAPARIPSTTDRVLAHA
ncbi:Hint domain-containing protein [Yoonia maritima]|uniref:Hint domain-containing protein n=1 Tax=Yoonia maritima TaxID=1435347 RepID=UPI003736011C